MADQPKSKRRHNCAYCGKDMGEWDARYCDRTDTCGDRECKRYGREERQAERE